MGDNEGDNKDDEDNQVPLRSRNSLALNVCIHNDHTTVGSTICGSSYGDGNPDIWDNEGEQQQPASLLKSPGMGSLLNENVVPGLGDSCLAGEPEDSAVGLSHVKNGKASANKTGNSRGRGSGRCQKKERKGRGDDNRDDDEGGPGEAANYWLPAFPRGGLAVPPAWVASGLDSIDDV